MGASRDSFSHSSFFAMSGKRKKTKEEKAFSAKRENTNVVCKLSRVCKDLDLLAEIRRTCIVLKQVQLEAWHIANLHVLRCLENDIELPTLDQTFFNWCCQGARATGIRETKPKAEKKEVKTDRQRAPKQPMDEDLRETVQLYRLERERVEDYINPPQLEYDGNVMLDIAGKMRVNAENMIVLHFAKRLTMYARLLLEEKSGKSVRAKEVKRLVQACYRAANGEFTEDEIELREWLELMPYENVIKNNLEHFIKKLYKILQKVEASQLKDSEKKGIRSFSLLPFSSSYAASHVVINGSTLHGFCTRIFKETGGSNPLDIPLRASGKVLISQEDVCKSKELFLRRAFAISQFETMAPNGTISKREFNVMNHESKALFASRLFANQITTNGYSASVLLTRLKSDMEIVKKKKKTKYVKKKKETETTETTENGDDELDWEWRTLPPNFEPSDMIAIDPGMRSLCTAVNEVAGTRTDETYVERVVEISTKEYRHKAGMNKARYWHENLKKREKQYAETIASIPSYKISSYEKYRENLKIFWKHVNFLLQFSANNSFLKWRFFQYRMKNKAWTPWQRSSYQSRVLKSSSDMVIGVVATIFLVTLQV